MKIFYLSDNLKSKYPTKYDIELTFNDFVYENDMIPVQYEYNLDEQDLFMLLELISEANNTDGETLYNFLLNLFDEDEEEVMKLLSRYIDYNEKSDIVNTLKEKCKTKAYEEFRDAFEYWVDEEDMDSYYKTEEITDFK